MARKINTENTEKTLDLDIEKTIEEYFIANSQKGVYTKQVTALGGTIKEYFSKNDITERKAGKYIATIVNKSAMSYDDMTLLAILKELPEEIKSKVVKTVEVVDEAGLEKLLLTGELSTDILKPAIREKITPTLYVKEIKEK